MRSTQMSGGSMTCVSVSTIGSACSMRRPPDSTPNPTIGSGGEGFLALVGRGTLVAEHLEGALELQLAHEPGEGFALELGRFRHLGFGAFVTDDVDLVRHHYLPLRRRHGARWDECPLPPSQTPLSFLARALRAEPVLAWRQERISRRPRRRVGVAARFESLCGGFARRSGVAPRSSVAVNSLRRLAASMTVA